MLFSQHLFTRTDPINNVLSRIVRINKDNNFSFDLFNRKEMAFGSLFAVQFGIGAISTVFRSFASNTIVELDRPHKLPKESFANARPQANEPNQINKYKTNQFSRL